MGEMRYICTILDLGTSWRRVVSFTPWLLFLRGNGHGYPLDRRLARKADSHNASCELIVQKMWDPRRLTTLWAYTACYRDSFTFFSMRKCTAAERVKRC
jgi:hypothetical protein